MSVRQSLVDLFAVSLVCAFILTTNGLLAEQTDVSAGGVKVQQAHVEGAVFSPSRVKTFLLHAYFLFEKRSCIAIVL
jgi:hypothetical protein